MATKSTADDGGEQKPEYPDAEYNHELPDAEKERRMSPWGYDSWDDVDLDAVECKRHPGSTDGRLACHAYGCPGGQFVELLGQPVDFEPGHPGDFCEVYECADCGGTGRMIIEHYPVANEYSTVQDFDTQTRYTGVLRE
jgi:hypothetical protein